jgi:ATP-dependent Clp protease ATP-binding subunit ClpA
MFERFTEQARRTLFFARYETTQLGDVSIATEHLLLGLIRESGDVVGRIFADADVSYEGVRKRIDQGATRRPRTPTSVEIPFTAETKRVLQYAAEEADRLSHRHIGTEHLLLALLRIQGTTAERCLASKGLSADRVREQIRDQGASSADGTATFPSRVEAVSALERVSSLLARLRQATNAEVPEIAASIQLELALVRRALEA